MSEADRITRGQAAERALEQFLGPAFDVAIADYTRKVIELASSQPWETDKIRKLSSAIMIGKAVREQIEQLVRDGDAALADKKRADKIANLSDTRKRLGIGGF